MDVLVITRHKQSCLAALGVEVWQLRPEYRSVAETPVVAAESLVPDPGLVQIPVHTETTAQMPTFAVANDWDGLQQQVQRCTRCDLHHGRQQAVLGTGSRTARWLFIGEAPGAEEDKQGEPFVGAAGVLLNAMLSALGLRRDEVYITNVVKCRPPGNRDPATLEIASCTSYLHRQIELVSPGVIVLLGRIAAHTLLQTHQPLASLRAQLYHYGEHGIPMVATYHPASLLRSPQDKPKAWQDLCLAKQGIAAVST